MATLPPAEEVARIVNPSGLPTYSGPVGTVRGLVRMTGDAPPSVPLAGVQSDCELPAAFFGKLFREGPERAVADVLVAVTGYQGFVPASGDTVSVEGTGCVWDRRTIVMMFGQKIDVTTTDRKPYVPELRGQTAPAQLFVLPGAEPVSFVPRKPGRFLLHDSMRLYNQADVFVVTYPTTDVTELDGSFEIRGIPVGKAKVSAFLPATNSVVEKEIEVKADAPLDLTLELHFEQKADKK